MKKIFITYGDAKFKNTLHRIRSEAKSLNIFDDIIIYTPDDLPDYIKSLPVMAFERGGGYWIWKPYIIWHTLQKCNKGDIVVFTDAGCTLRSSEDWKYYFELMKDKETLVFNYRDDVDYGWSEEYGCNSPMLKYWTKQRTLSYFNDLFIDESWHNLTKVIAGFVICKKGNNQLIKEWLSVCIMHPELLIDPFGAELNIQNPYFVVHRHDICVFSPLAYYFQQKDGSVLILPEKLESQKNQAAVVATRIRSMRSPRMNIIRKIIGAESYEKLKLSYRKRKKQ